ncbi:hypothetical protein HK100_000537 [Physocladia obscura]|uniref:Uncharacterized protein n=1 Tax=Physocladia obscura TaxID=109957 RepID=A0AAD5XGW0_9FUNG|nr:hypothetical protein HK100_000537 [Physocladia obscura]
MNESRLTLSLVITQACYEVRYKAAGIATEATVEVEGIFVNAIAAGISALFNVTVLVANCPHVKNLSKSSFLALSLACGDAMAAISNLILPC